MDRWFRGIDDRLDVPGLDWPVEGRKRFGPSVQIVEAGEGQSDVGGFSSRDENQCLERRPVYFDQSAHQIGMRDHELGRRIRYHMR